MEVVETSSDDMRLDNILEVDLIQKTDIYFSQVKQRIGQKTQTKLIEYLLDQCIRQDKSKNTWYYFDTNLPKQERKAWKRMTEKQLLNFYRDYQTFFTGEKPDNIHKVSWERRNEFILDIHLPDKLYSCKPFVKVIRETHFQLPKLR